MVSRQVVAPATDRDSAPWWEALTRHELVVQRCAGCAVLRWPPRELCGRCGNARWTWARPAATGTVASWNVTWRTPIRDAQTPYVVVLTRLGDQDDILIPGGFAGPPSGEGLAVGAPVVAVFRDIEVGAEDAPLTLLDWRLADSEVKS